MNKTSFLYCGFLVAAGLNVFGQIDMQFKYRYSSEFKQPVFSQVFLTFPNGNMEKLYSDTSKISEFLYANYLHDKGKYELKVIFESNEYGKDSIDYPFELNGEEIDIEIDVSFYYGLNNLSLKQKEKEKKPTGYVYVRKYYKQNEGVSIHLSDIESSEIWGDTLQGFHFILTNNSKDTLYGKYLSGYFWGTISIMNSDSTWGKKKTGDIDTQFVRRPPLYPNSVTFATVGSWGYFPKILKNRYKYELLYSVNKWESLGHIRMEKDSFLWYVSTKEYHKLIYEFEIE